MVVPIRVGSGIRVKILMGVSYGVPVVSTPVGAEGIPFKHGVSAYLAEDAKAFASAAVGLLKDPEHARLLAEAALDSVIPEFSPESALRRRLAVFEEVVRSKASPRTSDEGSGRQPRISPPSEIPRGK